MSNLELNCKWHFAKQLGGRDDGPNDPMQENFKKTPYASLIRESIQNSLDVPLDSSKPVKVEFSISRIQSVDYNNFFMLQKHIKGCLDLYSDNQDAKEVYQPMLDYFANMDRPGKLFYIKVADYNTTGMDYIKNNTNNPFYAFVRAAGVSSKKDATAGGSFGYGKAAYFYISPIRSILVSSMTKSQKCFFEGVASLCTHKLDGEEGKFVSVGYYDNNNGEPVTNPNDIPKRFSRNEPGTDIYILGVDATNKEGIYKEMIEAVLRNFWLAIYNGKLEVKVNDVEITKETIADIMFDIFPDDTDDKRRETGYNPRPYLDAVANVGKDNKHILIEKQMPKIGKVQLYAVKDKRATDKIIYMRRPMMLVKARRTQSSNGFYGVFLCEDKSGNELLRKTENPAHNEWSSTNWRENGRIAPKGREAIDEVDRFVIEAMEQLFSNRDKTVQDIQGLEDFLYIPTAIEDDEEMESESLIGDIIGKREDEGNAISTDLTGYTQSGTQEEPAVGKVMIDDPTTTRRTRNKAGDALSGHGQQKKKQKGGGGVTARDIDSHYDESEEGLEGSFLTEIPVTYRAFAQSEGGKVIHNIVIHSDYEFNNGRIDLLVGGEQSDDVVTIKDCSPAGIIKGNTISGLHLDIGRNLLKIRFADNMKHAIKLDAYENK